MHRKQGRPMVKLRLSLTLFDVNLFCLIDRCVSTAVGDRVKEIYLCINPGVSSLYVLPQTVFLADSLMVLYLKGCGLEDHLISRHQKCRNLRTLFLDKIQLDERMLRKLTSICSQIKTFCIWECEGISKVAIPDLRNLKRLEICTLGNQEVVIEAPELVSLYYGNYSIEHPCSFSIEKSLESLKHVFFEATNMTATFLSNLLARLPLIESLRLQRCNQLKKIRLSSETLKHCSILSCDNLEEASLDFSNLLSLEYFGGPSIITSLVLWSLKGQSKTCKIHLMLFKKPSDHEFCIKKLREIRMIPKFEIESLTIYVDASYSAIRYRLFRVFSPRHFSAYWYCTNGKFMEFMGQKMLDRRKPICCASFETKCWQQNFDDVQFECFRDINMKWQILRKQASEAGHLCQIDRLPKNA